jgi:hypothetical protein
LPNIKQIQPLSDWLEIELRDTRLLDPPVFRVRVKPALGTDMMDCVAGNLTKPSEILFRTAVEAIQEWDLMIDDKPLPCTDEEKKKQATFIEVLLKSYVRDDNDFVASKIVRYAQDIGNFLKN